MPRVRPTEDIAVLAMLGPRALAAWGLHRARLRLGLVRRALADAPVPAGPFLGIAPPAVPPPAPLPPHALDIDPFAGADIRPLWETARWGELVGLAPAEADRRIAAFLAANPPFRGPHWVSAQEAAIRLLHLAYAAVIHDRDADPPPGLRTLAALHWRRVRAEADYEAAQDNNHSLAAAATGLAAGLLTRNRTLSARALRRTERVAAKLIAPCGAFSQHSARYQRMAVDLLSLAALLARRQGLRPDFDALHAAAAAWLDRVTDPVSGRMARIGHDDGTALVAPPPPPVPPRPGRWSGRGFMGFAAGAAWALLRVPGSRFRPAHADLLHLDLWHAGRNLLGDGGTGAYHPAPAERWWLDHFPAVEAHNTVQFDGAPQLRRRGRFLMGPWPAGGVLADGGWVRDASGNRHERRVHTAPGEWQVEDRLAGAFANAVLRWRLDPELEWTPAPDGARGDGAVIAVEGAATVALERGWVSPAYGRVTQAPVLVAHLPAGTARAVTRITLANAPG